MRIKDVVSHLAKTGYLKRKKFSAEKQSEVNIDDEQRKMIHDLVSLLDKFQIQDPEVLEKGRQLMGKILADPTKVSLLMRKAKEHSSNANKEPTEEMMNQVLYIVSAHPNCTNADIRMALKENGRRLSRTRVAQLLRFLIKKGSVERFTERGQGYYTVKEQES